MTESGRSQARAARAERLGTALRENLKRRKAQARGRRSDRRPSEQPPEPIAEAAEANEKS
jgi:hypothetical protein